jgi:DNA-binding transcriptional MerR regulator
MENIEKTYYSIGETARMFEVNASLLRFWEKEFPVIKPFKNKKGDRFYSNKDIENIRTIYYLTKVKGYTLQGARDAMNKNMLKEGSTAQVVNTLLKVKKMLTEIKKNLID